MPSSYCYRTLNEPSTVPWIKYHNIVNPTPGSSKSLIPAITQSVGGHVEPVSFKEWYKALEATASKTEDVAKNPGYQATRVVGGMQAAGGEVELETTETAKKSQTLRDLPAVGPGWMEIWLKQVAVLNGRVKADARTLLYT